MFQRSNDYWVSSYGCIGSNYVFDSKGLEQVVELVGGWVLLGNMVGWEQCRSLRRRSMHMMEKAKQEREEKNRKKWQELQKSQGKNDDMEKFNEFNNRK